MKKIYITMGDPRGIGPEIIFKSLKEISEPGVPVVIGDREILKTCAEKYGMDISDERDSGCKPGSVYYIHIESKNDPGYDSLNYIEKAVALCKEQSECALVTGPVIKESIARIRSGFMGHTEYIARLTEAGQVAMVFISPKIKMSLLTTHLPLKKVSSEINTGHIVKHVKIIQSGLKRLFKMDSPRIALCSINPHAGEQGLLGDEEESVFLPGVEELRKHGVNITGPISPAPALKGAIKGEFDFIVSVYHDQLLTAVRIFLGPCVNLTMGLGFVRTSPDHGPCLDIAGKDTADYTSMKSAIELAADLIYQG